jgi:hypothetical protein
MSRAAMQPRGSARTTRAAERNTAPPLAFIPGAHMRRRIVAILLVLAPLSMAATWIEPPLVRRDPVAMNGHAWDSLSSEAREAWLAGFIAGAAAHQALGDRRDVSGARVAANALLLRNAGALQFPFAVNVYRSHLDDYYFYRNRRSETLLQVLVDMNARNRSGR